MSSSLTASIESFIYPGMDRPLLRDVQLSARAGDCALVSGPGGSGKTSLGYCLANVIPGFYKSGTLRGAVDVNGVTVTGLSLARSARSVGLLLQEPERQLCHLTVAEDIAFGPENLGVAPARVREIVTDLAARLNLGALLARSPHTLSSGEAQRAALAATLALDAPVLVFDQPTAHLDRPSRHAFYALLARLRQAGKIVVVAESDLRRDDLAAQATHELDLARSDGASFACLDPVVTLPLARVGRPAGAEGEPLLWLDGLSFAYGDRPVLQIDALSLRRGECAAVVGENGSGKTTLLRVLAGLRSPQAGTIGLQGRDITRLPAARRSAQIAYLPSNPDALLAQSSAAAEIAAALRLSPAAAGTVGEWLEVVGLQGQAGDHPLTLPHGARYRLALAVLLARAPVLLLLDEPTGTLDQAETAWLCALIDAFCATGRSALMVSHDPDVLAPGTVSRILQIEGHRLSEAAPAATPFFVQRRSYEDSVFDRTGRS